MDGLLGTKDANSEAGSRLRAVTNGSAAVAYNYLDGSPLFGQITFSQSGQTRMTTTKSYDYLHPVRYRPHITRDGSQRPQRPEGGRSTRAGLSHGVNRLTRISSVPSASSVVSFDYAYNNANQRTSVTLGPDRSYWTYGYDNLGQLTNGVKYWYDGVPFSGQQFQYTFDDIGNRKQTKAGGDSNGQNLRVAWYTNTLLNQITNRTVPGSNDILGIAHASATVTVNGQSPYRRGEYYRKELALTNTASPVYAAVGNVAVLGTNTTTATGQLFLAKSPETFTYDADGNLTQDGRWNYTWDGENRLVRMVSLMNNTLTNSWLTLSFAYDRQGRRISKTVSNYVAGSWQLKSDQRFIYDGWNLLAILSSDLSLQASFCWGLDLSGSVQGAGGVGGLLGLNDASNGVFFVACDGNGNVAAMVNATNGTASAQYEYGPFGEVVRATGPIAKANPFRFSTKFQDDETDFLYYGYRYYIPTTGRWLSRDPLGEEIADNLYNFVRNDSVNLPDVLGLYQFGGLQTFYGASAPGSPIGGTEHGATGGKLEIVKLTTQLKNGACLCCLKELNIKLTLKVYLPNVGDKLEGIAGLTYYTFTVTAQNQANFRQHEEQHVNAHYRIAGTLCPNLEKDCTGKCESRWFGRAWTAKSCQDWWEKEIEGELDWVKKRMYEAGAEFDSRTRYFNEHVSLTQQFIDNYNNYVTQELADWSKHKFCD